MHNRELHGRVAVVTGATRARGIGAAVCRALAAEGADVFFTHWTPYDRTQYEGLDEGAPAALEGALRATGARCASTALDLSEPDAHTRLLDAVAERLGAPAILVNNAAYSTRDDYAALSAESLDAHYAVNMRGAFLLSAEFARRWRGGPGGRISNFTSGQSLGPMPGELAYIATKGAIEAFTRSLAAGVAERGITVNAIDPGPTDTGWMTEEFNQALLPRFPFGRLGPPEDAARLVAFLASDAAAWITGRSSTRRVTSVAGSRAGATLPLSANIGGWEGHHRRMTNRRASHIMGAADRAVLSPATRRRP